MDAIMDVIMDIKQLREKLLEEHKRVCWGCLLCFPNEFFSFLEDGMRVLDVGCNVQMLKKGILERKPHCEVYGIDIVDYSVLYPDRSDKKPDVLASGEAIPFVDKSFDFVCFIEALEHMDAEKAIKEAYRVLKPNGRLFVQSVHKDDPAYRSDPTHMYPLDEEKMVQLLEPFRHKEVKRIRGTILAKAIK